MYLESVPDDALLEMYKYFNIGKLRLNKKLKERIEAFKFKKIHLKVKKNEYFLTVSKTWIVDMKFENEGRWNVVRLAKGIRAWSGTFSAHQVEIEMVEVASFASSPSTSIIFIEPAIEALLQFNTDKLFVHGNESVDKEIDNEFAQLARDFDLDNFLPVTFPHLKFSTLLVMSANATEVTMNLRCCTLDATDLHFLHTNLIKGGCKLSSFTVKVYSVVAREFLKMCFGIVVLEENRKRKRSIEYQFVNEAVSIYSSTRFPTNEIIFNGIWKTEVNGDKITIESITSEEKSAALKGLFEIELFNKYKNNTKEEN